MKRSAKLSLAATAAAAALALVLPLEGCRMSENVHETPAPGASPAAGEASEGRAADALSVHREAVVIDLHADTVQFMVDEGADINGRLKTTHLDAVRMREGGLDAQFFSIWVEPEAYGLKGARSVARADEQIAAVRALAERNPETWVLATSASDIRRAKGEGKLSALIGLEGGYAIDERIENVERYYRMGVRYMTPTW